MSELSAAALSRETATDLLGEKFAPWVQALNLSIEEIGPDGVAMRLPYSDDLCRTGGLICGQAMMTLADTCMVFVVAAALGGFREMATASQNTSFFRPAIGTDVIARGRVLKTGRMLVFGEVTLYADGDDRPVAHATSTYALPPVKA